MQTKIEVLQNCTVEGNIVKLPEGQLDRKLYLEVAKALELIGGKWKGGKVMGFVFPNDPTDLLNQIAGGEHRNLKKEYQFFETPDDLADELVDLVFIQHNHDILEPSAGQGAIIKAIHRAYNVRPIWAYELMDINRTFLNKIPDVRLLGDDFLQCDTLFDIIIANPPFTKNQDIDHIRKMYDCLKPGGTLVSVASNSWVIGSQKKQIEFKAWLKSQNHETFDIEAGRFKQSGTLVGAKIIKIDKPINPNYVDL